MQPKNFFKFVALSIFALVGVVSCINYVRLTTPVVVQEQKIGAVAQRLSPFERTVLSAVTSTAVGSSMNIADYQLIGFTIATQATTATLKFACSMADFAPNFSSTSSATNKWAYVNVLDYDNGTTINGGAGFTFANSTTVRQVYLPNSTFRWCTVNQSNSSGGPTTVTMLPATNQ